MIRSFKVGAALASAAFVMSAARADGSILAAVDPVSHVLTVTGDGSPNDLAVTMVSIGTYTLTGRNGTLVNGEAAVTFEGVRTFDFDLANGDDVLQFTDVIVRGSLRVRLDEGADTVRLSGVRVRGRTAIRGEGGDDHVITSGNSVFAGTFAVSGGDQGDRIELTDSTFRNRVSIGTGDGANVVLLQHSTFEQFAQLRIGFGAGDDELRVDDCTVDNDLKADMRSGDDQAVLTDSHFKLDVSLNGGGGSNDDLSYRSGNRFRRFPSFRSFEE